MSEATSEKSYVGKILWVPVKREIIRVEPLSTYLERWKAPTSAVTRCGDTIYVSGFPPFDSETGTVSSIYARYFPKDPPARIFVCVPAWPGPFDIEMDCIAALA
jgi:2-iminobutanoate/2-iminopropanoate deaminase